mmetsp:Transcript_15244/g.47552  ORF Transcript_15244/g.47552 Transcript_15244/m.47552 type:complete len:251 (+) Transcript_15244:1351-2103(+)
MRTCARPTCCFSHWARRGRLRAMEPSWPTATSSPPPRSSGCLSAPTTQPLHLRAPSPRRAACRRGCAWWSLSRPCGIGRMAPSTTRSRKRRSSSPPTSSCVRWERKRRATFRRTSCSWMTCATIAFTRTTCCTRPAPRSIIFGALSPPRTLRWMRPSVSQRSRPCGRRRRTARWTVIRPPFANSARRSFARPMRSSGGGVCTRGARLRASASISRGCETASRCGGRTRTRTRRNSRKAGRADGPAALTQI